MNRRKGLLSGLSEEIQDHIERETNENIERGLAPEEARRVAERKFGNVTRVEEDTREVWGIVWLEQLRQDIRYGLRALWRNPGFTAVVILTLALGIGMSTAVFSVVNSVLLRPLAYPDAERLVWLTDYDYLYEHRDNYVSRPAFMQWKEQARSFEAMAAYGNQDLALIANDQSSQERVASITDDFWSITGGRARVGRLFGAGEAKAIVLSYALFERRFGADPAVIGKTVTINGHAFTITGVLEPQFRFLFPLQFANGDEVRDVDAYIPVPGPALRLPAFSARIWEEGVLGFGPAPYNVRVVGKLRPGVSLDRARAEMETVYANAARSYPDFRRKHVRLHFDSLAEKLVGESRASLMVLLGAVGFVLLIACANTANLLMARASARAREMAIRTAIGAGRLRMIRQLVTESLVLALLGGAAGLLLSTAVIAVLGTLSTQARDAVLDARVLAFTLAVSLVTGLLFGLGPALLEANAGRRTLVVIELALAVVLLTGAGLMMKSFWRMNEHTSGFSPENVLVMRVSLSGPQYASWPQKQAYIDQLLQRLSGSPGIQNAGIDCGNLNASVKVDGQDPRSAAIRAVSAGYLRAMGVPLLRGRWPAEDEMFGVVVNESFAGSADPIGKRIGGSILNDVIVGVVADFKHRQLDAEPTPEIYMRFERFPMVRSVKVVARVVGDPGLVAPAIRKQVSEIDRTQPTYEFQTLQQALSDSIAPRRFNLILLGTFAATALLMALIGIYGVVAYSVARRTHEIGIRLAIGARRGQIAGMVVGQGMRFVLTGIAIGSAAALGLTRLMAGMFYGVKPHDPQIFAAVAAILTVTAMIACWRPALKAAFVDPIIALRHD